MPTAGSALILSIDMPEEPVSFQISPRAERLSAQFNKAESTHRDDNDFDIELATLDKGPGRVATEQLEVKTDGPEETVKDTPSRPHVNLQLAVVYFTIFVLGFQDGSLGPLIPVIQRVYGVGQFSSLFLC